MATEGFLNTALDIGKKVLGITRDTVGSKPVGGALNTGNNLLQIITLFSGIFDGKDENGQPTHDVAKKANATANAVKVAGAFSEFLGGRKQFPDTVGRMTEALTDYMYFDKIDQSDDGVAMRKVKALVIGTVVGWLAEKVAGGIYNNSTSLQTVVNGMQGKTAASHEQPSGLVTPNVGPVARTQGPANDVVARGTGS